MQITKINNAKFIEDASAEEILEVIMSDAVVRDIRRLEKYGYYNHPLDLVKKCVMEIWLKYTDTWMPVQELIKRMESKKPFNPHLYRRCLTRMEGMEQGVNVRWVNWPNSWRKELLIEDGLIDAEMTSLT